METPSELLEIPDAEGKPRATIEGAFAAALKFLGTIALMVFAFVILNTVGDTLNLAARSPFLEIPHFATLVILMIGYGLQVFAAVWFVGIAVGSWNFFVVRDSAIHKA